LGKRKTEEEERDMDKGYSQVVKDGARRHSILADSRTGFAEATSQPISPATLCRVDCCLCRRFFTLDVDAHWNTLPEEMEVEGRRFLGIREDSVLCPECVGDVQAAGAERMYWALSQSL
jgi:hypothetical protein